MTKHHLSTRNDMKWMNHGGEKFILLDPGIFEILYPARRDFFFSTSHVLDVLDVLNVLVLDVFDVFDVPDVFDVFDDCV